MAERQKKQSWLTRLSPVQRTVLGLVIIGLVVVMGVIYGPHYDTDNTTSGDSPAATVTVTGLVNQMDVARGVQYQGISVTVTSVQQAKGFSDDGKSQYGHAKYILRLNLSVQAAKNQPGPVGVPFSQIAHLVLPDGSLVKANLSQISPDILPGATITGHLDFWTQEPLTLSQLGFELNGETVAFGQ